MVYEPLVPNISTETDRANFARAAATAIIAALNYADSLGQLRHFEEAKSLLRKTVPVARRVLGDSHELALKMRWTCARALYIDPGATLDDLREAVTTLEDTARTVRRVFGGEHTITKGTESGLRNARAVLRARETPSLG